MRTKFCLIILLSIFLISCNNISDNKEKEEIKSFDDCIKAGYPAMESYPRQCAIPNGDVFVEEIETISCPEDLLQCPDNSFVSRVPPDCEFAKCQEIPKQAGPIACTMDAKQCPDGTFVGRIAPDCEFAPCNRKEPSDGICIDNCGNGLCEEMVCMGSGCPCPETIRNCPQDC